MNACLLRNSNWRKYPAMFCILPVLAAFGIQPCWGDQLSLAPVMPSQNVWRIIGPSKASLGTIADIDVPQGYRLADEMGARILLERMKNPVPDGLIGILAPESGKWWAILTYTDIGYVKNADKEQHRSGGGFAGCAEAEREAKQRARRTRDGVNRIRKLGTPAGV